MSTTARIGLTLALATVLMVLSTATASGITQTSYFCTNARPKVIREVKGKTATAGWRSKKFCVTMGMRKVPKPILIEGPEGVPTFPENPPPTL